MRAPGCLLAVALASGLALAACGGGDEDGARAAAERYLRSDEGSCQVISTRFLRQNFAGDRTTCRQRAKAYRGPRNFTIRDVEVDGDKARVESTLGRQSGTVTLVKEGGDWKVDTARVDR